MKTKIQLLLAILAFATNIGMNAQGVKIYKSRGSMQTISYNQLDSIVVFNQADKDTTASIVHKQYFSDSELLLNDNGSIYHLSLKPEQLADNVILVGDIGRVPLVAANFDSIDCDIQHREVHSITGYFQGKRITGISSGSGCDNMDIVVNELDALANIDFATRTIKPKLRQLNLIRIGTCGGLQLNTPTGTFVATVKGIGFEGLLNFYGGRDSVCDLQMEAEFTKHMQWPSKLCDPYVVNSDSSLVDKIAGTDMVRGITISCGGFFGPQGRELRIPLANPKQNEMVESFSYNGLQITNFEMENSAMVGLARLLGHRAMTCCLVIANRRTQNAVTDYEAAMRKLIREVLERL